MQIYENHDTVEGLYEKDEKLPLFVFILAVMLSTGGSCMFPVLTAHASSGAIQMVMMNDQSEDAHGMDQIAQVPLSQSHVNVCTTDCGQSNNDVVVIQNVKDTLEFPLLVFQDTYTFPSLFDGINLRVLESSVSPPSPDALLAVAQKE